MNAGNATDSLSGAGFIPPTSSSIGQIDEGVQKQGNIKKEQKGAFYISASIILGTMAALWAGIGCCFEQLLPVSVARGLARCDMFSHSHFSKTLPRIILAQRTVLGGLTTLFSLIAAVFVLAYALIENSADIWDYAGQYAAIDSELCKWQSLVGCCVSLSLASSNSLMIISIFTVQTRLCPHPSTSRSISPAMVEQTVLPAPTLSMVQLKEQ